MKHIITDIPYHPALREWMSRCFGEVCSSADILVVESLAYLVCIYAYDLEKRHMQVVRKFANIARLTGRPQRVPIYREYRALAESYDRDFEAPGRRFGASLVPTRASKAMLDRIVAHERAAAAKRIAATRAA
ncbi:hypothetical protein [Rhizobium sp.]|uniref:hypothetical protein n=1 Tax=Rhizobium sp. TaxID=391 RepID=UPI0034C5CDEE